MEVTLWGQTGLVRVPDLQLQPHPPPSRPHRELLGVPQQGPGVHALRTVDGPAASPRLRPAFFEMSTLVISPGHCTDADGSFGRPSLSEEAKEELWGGGLYDQILNF